MSLLVGLITIILIAKILKMIGVEEIGCWTIITIMFILPMITHVGDFVLSLF